VFTGSFEVSYGPESVVAVDVNKNNVMIVLFKESTLQLGLDIRKSLKFTIKTSVRHLLQFMKQVETLSVIVLLSGGRRSIPSGLARTLGTGF